MKSLIRKCNSCNKYTLKLSCPTCGVETKTPHPPKFSPDDRYARYRLRERYESID